MSDTVRLGVIGAGLMGRELAIACERWPTFAEDLPEPRITAVCDVADTSFDWFQRLGTVDLFTTDYRELLASGEIDAVYIAVPHNLHEEIYVATAEAGLDLMGEKPFGIDLPAAERLVAAIDASGIFARCSSEMPFYPGAQYAIDEVRSGGLGQIIEANSGLLHSSDLNPAKPINWKRQQQYCGELGVLGDLGMHAIHIPLRLGWLQRSTYAVTQQLVEHRPGPNDDMVPCDTYENATILSIVDNGTQTHPLTIETKRVAPGNMNTWYFRAIGMTGGVEFSTRYPKTVRRFTMNDAGEQVWETIELGVQSVFPTSQGGIFEFGFSDAILQMWAAFIAERAGMLGARFGCCTPAEALESHRWLDAARRSGKTNMVVETA